MVWDDELHLRDGSGLRRRHQPKQLIDGDRKIADAHGRRMKDRIGDGSSRAYNTNLADAFHSEGVEMRLPLVDEDDLNVMYIGIHRHMILGKIVIDEMAISVANHTLRDEAVPTDSNPSDTAANAVIEKVFIISASCYSS
jgi:hypothetical protein